jgi:hypothetical protein
VLVAHLVLVVQLVLMARERKAARKDGPRRGLKIVPRSRRLHFVRGDGDGGA